MLGKSVALFLRKLSIPLPPTPITNERRLQEENTGRHEKARRPDKKGPHYDR